MSGEKNPVKLYVFTLFDAIFLKDDFEIATSHSLQPITRLHFMMLVATNPQRIIIIIIIIIIIKSSVPLSSEEHLRVVSRHNKQLLIMVKKHCTQPAQHQMAGREREAGEDGGAFSDEPDISLRRWWRPKQS